MVSHLCLSHHGNHSTRYSIPERNGMGSESCITCAWSCLNGQVLRPLCYRQDGGFLVDLRDFLVFLVGTFALSAVGTTSFLHRVFIFLLRLELDGNLEKGDTGDSLGMIRPCSTVVLQLSVFSLSVRSGRVTVA